MEMEACIIHLLELRKRCWKTFQAAWTIPFSSLTPRRIEPPPSWYRGNFPWTWTWSSPFVLSGPKRRANGENGVDQQTGPAVSLYRTSSNQVFVSFVFLLFAKTRERADNEKTLEPWRRGHVSALIQLGGLTCLAFQQMRSHPKRACALYATITLKDYYSTGIHQSPKFLSRSFFLVVSLVWW